MELPNHCKYNDSDTVILSVGTALSSYASNNTCVQKLQRGVGKCGTLDPHCCSLNVPSRRKISLIQSIVLQVFIRTCGRRFEGIHLLDQCTDVALIERDALMSCTRSSHLPPPSRLHDHLPAVCRCLSINTPHIKSRAPVAVTVGTSDNDKGTDRHHRGTAVSPYTSRSTIQDGAFTTIITWAETTAPSTTTGSADQPKETSGSATQR